MFLFTTLLLSALTFYVTAKDVTATRANDCCPNGNKLFNAYSCSGDTIANLTCDTSRLLLNMTSMKYNVDADGNLDLGDATTRIPKQIYCISAMHNTTIDVILVCNIWIGEPEMTNYTLTASCALISVVMLLLTVVVYILVPTLRDLQGKCILHSITSLALAMFLLAFMQFEIITHEMAFFCVFAGYALFVSFLVAFAWTNVIAFNIWKTAVCPTKFSSVTKWHLYYCAFGYGLPAFILIFALVCANIQGDHVKPDIGEYSCWFMDRTSQLRFFYAPMATMICINLVFYLWTAKGLWNDITESTLSSRTKSLRYKCTMCLRMFLVVGLSWTFEVFSFIFNQVGTTLTYVWTVTDYINALEGVLIFCVLVLFRKKAIRGLASYDFFGVRLPQQWKTLHDEEDEDEKPMTQHENGI